MTHAQAFAVNPFENKQKGKHPDIIQDVTAEKDKDIEFMLRQYKSIQRGSEFEWEHLAQKITYTPLSPSQIQVVLDHIVRETPAKLVEHNVTADFITNLIQDSYTEGYDRFVLNLGDRTIHSLSG